MLLDIQIKNFRCFEDTKIEGFQRVNLIGGKNNSGKTALLEAIFIYISPEPQSILFLKELRKEFSSVNQKFPEITWENFFLNRNTEKEIELIGTNEEKIAEEINSFIFPRTVRLNTNQSERKWRNDESITLEINNIDSVNSGIERYSSRDYDLFVFNHNSYFRLYLSCFIDFTDEKDRKLCLDQKYTMETQRNKINISKKGEYPYYIVSASLPYSYFNRRNPEFVEKNPIFCVSSFAKISNQELARNFDLAILNDKSDQILNILQKLDPTIAEIRSLTINEPDIYLRRKGENFLPISLFGDCFNGSSTVVMINY